MIRMTSLLSDRQVVNRELKKIYAISFSRKNLGVTLETVMTFREWIEKRGGRLIVAEELGVTPVAIHYWLENGVTPRYGTLIKIAALSKGALSIDQLLHETKRVKTTYKPRSKKL